MYICSVCGEEIPPDNVHTASDGEDVHEGCCDLCQEFWLTELLWDIREPSDD